MKYCTIQPSPFLAPYIRHYWYLEMEANEAATSPQRITPTGFVEWIFHFGQPLQKDPTQPLPQIQICGQKNTFADLFPTGKVEMLSVRFHPHTPRFIFPFPLSEAMNQQVSFYDFSNIEARMLETQLDEALGLAAKVTVLEKYLTQKIIQSHNLFPLCRLGNCIRLIQSTRGQVNMERLANETCLSQRQLLRVFREYVGLSPHQFIRVFRFQLALHLQSLQSTQSLLELACRCHYSDPSHLNNEFREMSGLTPTQYFSQCQPFSDYFS
jgi:AraC-like DNA-binding protein